MAKMFYSLEEAAAKLGVSVDEVKTMADKRQLEVFRDRDRLMFKVEQVDLLSGGGKSKSQDDVIPLADSGELEPIGLASSGSGTGLPVPSDNPKEQTGISIFDADSTEESDPSAVTRVTNSPASALTAADPGASGSGLLDLSKDIEETKMGGSGILEGVYSGSASADQSAFGSADESTDQAVGSGNLFESPAGSGDAVTGGAAVASAMMVAAEPYDGPGSGLIGGLMLGVVASLGLVTFALLMAIAGSSMLLEQLGGANFPYVVGGMAGLTLILGVIGWLLGKKS